METTQQIARASAISAILSRAGFHKSISTTGFEAIQIAHYTQVWYTPRRGEVVEDILVRMTRILKDRGYVVQRPAGESRSVMLEVSKGEDAPVTEEESVTVTVPEVRGALLQGCYEASSMGAGFQVLPFWQDNSLIRVSYEDQPWTSYEKNEEETEASARRRYIERTLETYLVKLYDAGFAAERQRDSEGGLVDSILVGPPGTEFYTDVQRRRWEIVKEERTRLQQQKDDQTTKDSLLLAREVIENDNLAYSTRKAGPWSIFVFYLVPFKNRARRAEVFFDFDLGGYSVSYVGRRHERTFDLTKVVEILRDELQD
jgi:hypothetical protein